MYTLAPLAPVCVYEDMKPEIDKPKVEPSQIENVKIENVRMLALAALAVRPTGFEPAPSESSLRNQGLGWAEPACLVSPGPLLHEGTRMFAPSALVGYDRRRVEN